MLVIRCDLGWAAGFSALVITFLSKVAFSSPACICMFVQNLRVKTLRQCALSQSAAYPEKAGWAAVPRTPAAMRHHPLLSYN